MKMVFTLVLLVILAGCSSEEKYSDDFNFVFSYGVMKKNVLNTYNDSYTKDLVIDGVMTTELILTEEEMKNIYLKMKEIGLFQYPDEIVGMIMLPASGYTLETNYDGIKKTVDWIGEFNDTQHDKEFRQLTRMIIDLIESKEAYKSLPEINGYYE